MATSKLDRVLEEVKRLTFDEQIQLREILDELLEPVRAPMTEEEFEQKLLENGVICHIPPPITDLTPYNSRKLIKVTGKPLSETILEERR